MERAMAEPDRLIPRNRVMKVMTIGAFVVTGLVLLARFAGVLPMPQDMSPTAIVVFCVVISSAVIGFSFWYLTRTDEHDLHANLWSMTWAWIASAVITVDWAALHIAGLLPPPDAVTILLATAAVAGSAWVWLRFR
jgi:hypothetical protein